MGAETLFVLDIIIMVHNLLDIYLVITHYEFVFHFQCFCLYYYMIGVPPYSNRLQSASVERPPFTLSLLSSQQFDVFLSFFQYHQNVKKLSALLRWKSRRRKAAPVWCLLLYLSVQSLFTVDIKIKNMKTLLYFLFFHS